MYLHWGRKAQYIVIHPNDSKMLDSCPEPGKNEALKMLDLQTKSAINSYKLQV